MILSLAILISKNMSKNEKKYNEANETYMTDGLVEWER
jgi:hypothetical protein